MVQGINKEYIFQKDEEKLKYINLLKKYSEKYLISIIAYCIMDNHVHLLLNANDSIKLSSFMKEINLRYAMYYNKKNNRVGYVFRNRFESKVMLTELQILRCIKYIHMNPVKANLVENESQYKFSSYNDYINKSNVVNSKNLNLIFNSEKDYLKELLSIEYINLNLEKENINLEIILKQFLKQEQCSFEDITANKNVIMKFIAFLNYNGYKFSKTELAKILKISRTSLYRRLKDE